jgi:hypothetical protein
MSPLPEGSLSQQHSRGVPVFEQVPPLGRPDAINMPYEHLAHDPFADDAQRRGSRVR